jgi:prepilin-type N-terminal cleavage/methylation domain-containing protein
MCQRRAIRKRAAFTLIELMVVMVIMAIAAAIVVVSSSGGGGVKASSAAKVVAMDLEYAQNMAVTHQDPVTVTFSPDGESYTLSNASGPLVNPMTKEDYLVDLNALSGFDGVDMVSAVFGGTAAVTFDELGTPSEPGSVAVRSGSTSYQVSVAAATGKVTVALTGS